MNKREYEYNYVRRLQGRIMDLEIGLADLKEQVATLEKEVSTMKNRWPRWRCTRMCWTARHAPRIGYLDVADFYPENPPESPTLPDGWEFVLKDGNTQYGQPEVGEWVWPGEGKPWIHQQGHVGRLYWIVRPANGLPTPEEVAESCVADWASSADAMVQAVAKAIRADRERRLPEKSAKIGELVDVLKRVARAAATTMGSKVEPLNLGWVEETCMAAAEDRKPVYTKSAPAYVDHKKFMRRPPEKGPFEVRESGGDWEIWGEGEWFDSCRQEDLAQADCDQLNRICLKWAKGE